MSLSIAAGRLQRKLPLFVCVCVCIGDSGEMVNKKLVLPFDFLELFRHIWVQLAFFIHCFNEYSF